MGTQTGILKNHAVFDSRATAKPTIWADHRWADNFCSILNDRHPPNVHRPRNINLIPVDSYIQTSVNAGAHFNPRNRNIFDRTIFAPSSMIVIPPMYTGPVISTLSQLTATFKPA